MILGVRSRGGATHKPVKKTQTCQIRTFRRIPVLLLADSSLKLRKRQNGLTQNVKMEQAGWRVGFISFLLVVFLSLREGLRVNETLKPIGDG